MSCPGPRLQGAQEIRSGHVVTQEVERAGKYALGKCKVTIESEQGYKIVMEASGCDVESFTYYDIIKDEHLLAVHREKTGDKFLLHVDAEEMRFEDNGVEETVELIPKPRKRVIRG